jgi:large repetitive protein
MNRFHLRLPHTLLIATLLFLVSSSAVFAQVNYTLTGTLNLTSGTDPLGLSGDQVTLTTSISQTATPTVSSTTASSSTNTYGGLTIGIAVGGLSLSCKATSTPAVTVVLTDTVGAADTLNINNCDLAGLATLNAMATIPNGYMITAVPAAIPSVGLTSGTANFVLTSSGASGSFSLSSATLAATGTAPPTVTPSLTSVPLSSTTLSQKITFSTSPSAAVSFAASTSATWLTVSPMNANTSSPITITANPAGLTQSTTGTVTLTYGPPYSTTQISVTLNVSAPTVSLTAPASLTFSYTPGSTPPASQLLPVAASSPTTVNVAVTSGSSWLSVTPSSGSTPVSFGVSVNTTGLSGGVLTGNIQITATGATNSPLNVPVTLNVAAGTLTVPTTALTFNYTTGGSTPAAQSVSVSGTSGISFTTAAATTTGGTWLSATPSGTVPASVSISVNPSGLAAGAYSGTVTVTASGATGSPAVIPVTLNVAAVSLTATPSKLSFSYQVGGSTPPAAQTISVGDSSNASFTATAATVPAGGTWLSVTPGSGNASASLSVSVSTTGLAANTYNGTVTIAASGATSQVVNVTLVVAAQSGPTIAGVVSGASYATTGFAPGTIATIFGSLLGPTTGVAFSVNSSGTLDSTLAGVTVTVEGVPAIPLYVLSGQLNFILPFNLPTSGQAAVQVEYNNLTSVQFNIPLTAADVQIFTASGTGSGAGSILNQDGSINTATNPAPTSSYVSAFGTGGGVLGGAGSLGPAVTAGGVAGDTLSWIPAPYSATVNGATASVQYAGSAPGLVYGVNQFNVQIPAGTPSGAQKIVLTVGGSTSQSDVTVFVK